MPLVMFDIDSFIEEVRARPILWNTHLAEYWEKGNRTSRWSDVCRVMHSDFDRREDKEELCKTLITKWKSLRDNFVRFVKSQGKQTGRMGTTRRQYVHYNQLTFLLPTVHQKRAISSLEDADSQLPDIDDSNPGVDLPRKFEYQDMDESIPYCDLKMEESSYSGPPQLPQPVMPCFMGQEVTKDDLQKTEMKILHELSGCLKGHRVCSEDDDDSLFLLSLVREFKKVPDEHKLDARIEMMTNLKKWQLVRERDRGVRHSHQPNSSNSHKKRKTHKRSKSRHSSGSSLSDEVVT